MTSMFIEIGGVELGRFWAVGNATITIAIDNYKAEAEYTLPSLTIQLFSSIGKMMVESYHDKLHYYAIVGPWKHNATNKFDGKLRVASINLTSGKNQQIKIESTLPIPNGPYHPNLDKAKYKIIVVDDKSPDGRQIV